MKRSPLCLYLLAWCALMIEGCATSPENLYTLEYPSINRPGARNAPTIIVAPLSIPQLVDRPQLVTREGPVRVHISEQERWAAPLKDTLSRLLASQLETRLEKWRFVPAASAAHALPAGYLSIDISRLDLERGKGAILEAHWVYRETGDGGKIIEGNSNARSQNELPGYAALVSTFSEASAMLADCIAAQLSQNWQ